MIVYRDWFARRVLATVASVGLCMGVAACGGTSHASNSTTHSSAVPPSPSLTGDYDGDDEAGPKAGSDGDNDDHRPTDRDNDSDNSTGSYFDSDDRSVLDFGHAASSADKRTVAALVKRYFAIANAENGATACAMLARSLADSVVEDLGRPVGPAYAHGTTCPTVMSKVFAHYHRQLAAHASMLQVSAVRVDHSEGIAVLAFRSLPGRQIHVTREAGAWRIDGLLDIELP